MPCSDAMITNELITATPDMRVEDALELFQKHRIRSVPIVDADGKFLGIFNFHHLLNSILPAPLGLQKEDRRMRAFDLSLDHLTGQTEWLASRLQSLMERKLEAVMVRDIETVDPDTPLREGVRLMANNGSPLPVVDEKTGKLAGLISSQSAIRTILQIKADIKRRKPVEEISS